MKSHLENNPSMIIYEFLGLYVMRCIDQSRGISLVSVGGNAFSLAILMRRRAGNDLIWKPKRFSSQGM